jgi:two-component system OmpR family response regulator
MRVLVIEDDAPTAEINKRVLESEGFAVTVAATVAGGERLVASRDYDLIVTDLMLPDGHGLTIVNSVRQHGKTTPILVLTGIDAIESTVTALDMGADDYLTKPFDVSELRARVRALMRRGTAGGKTRVECHNVALDRMTRQAVANGYTLNLTPKEFTLLEYFLTQPAGFVISRSELLEKVWRIDFDPRTNVVDVNVARLRRKLQAAGAGCSIHPRRGIGYVLRPVPGLVGTQETADVR